MRKFDRMIVIQERNRAIQQEYFELLKKNSVEGSLQSIHEMQNSLAVKHKLSLDRIRIIVNLR